MRQGVSRARPFLRPYLLMSMHCKLISLFTTCVYQGDEPIPPPLAVPSPCASSTQLHPRDTEVNHIETYRRESESDEDDVSIPPGVILVTTPIEELSRDENASSGQGTEQGSFTLTA